MKTAPRTYGEEPWRQEEGVTVFAPFQQDADMIGPPEHTWMINFRVDDLDAIAEQLRSAGETVEVDPERCPMHTPPPRARSSALCSTAPNRAGCGRSRQLRSARRAVVAPSRLRAEPSLAGGRPHVLTRLSLAERIRTNRRQVALEQKAL